ncbi:hypothetical protein N825_36170 [Skermanella stibiiresistens SB22]|uniref:Uncharacterized protein n=1 Tax=Skermanella stibiiresistens SB22 TaxID=1385369 RepID=W9H656_9PROT|nr:hypothetical protein [Skermanella stibiiresistens]EWY40167.1 hypothetical protein N825_36170 [Skermanella stibiiresistens SB22]
MARHSKSTPPTRHEIATMLSALETQARQAAALAERAHHEASRDSFSGYFRFRAKVDEFQALIALIEERLSRVADEHAAELNGKFQQLDTVMLVMLVRTSTRFYTMLDKAVVLPLGARELFLPELRTLTEVRDRLMGQPEPVSQMTSGLVESLDVALVLIEALVQRAPSLPDFG